MAKNWDFSGWATKAGIKCSDGRTILPNAFSANDGMEVPLVWNHRHNDPSEVLGHALLENRDEGVYAYCSFNDNPKGREAKELVRHGDVKALSIYANQLVQSSRIPPCDVIHGSIKEVSLVLAGANVGAFIDNVMIHGELVEDEAEIYHGDYDEDFYIYHADDDEDDEDDDMEEKGKKATDILASLTDEQKAAVGLLIDSVMKSKASASHAEEEDFEEDIYHADDDDAKAVFNGMDDDQKKAVAAAIGFVLRGEEPKQEVLDMLTTLSSKEKKVLNELVDQAVSHSFEAIDDEVLMHSDFYSEEEDNTMKYNVFENYDNGAPVLSHADQKAILDIAAETRGSLKNVVMANMEEGGILAHAITDHNGNSVTYGVANIDYLFPDARAINNTPDLISNNQDWVNKVINGTHHTPFSRVKSLFADITGADARARGYVKGNQKVNEVIEALKRETTPQTIYKKQKLDRDDIIDITDFDVVAWLKAEMQLMLKAEIARAILIGDGREAGNDKIKEANVRPIYNDNDVYTVKVPVSVANSATDADVAAALIDAMILSRKDYKGSGNPTFFVSEDYLGQMLILKDGMGRRIYETEASLAAALRVKEIVPVDVMENQTIAIPTGVGTATADKPFIGLIVNLQDYNVGADKGGATSFFDDFDIDYNQYAYLYETRMSGALIKPKSAMSFYVNRAGSATT